MCAGRTRRDGCSAALPTPSPTTTETPSDDAVLAEAIDVYTRYSAAFDGVLAQAPEHANTQALRALVTPEYWSVLDGEFESRPRAWVQEGSSAFNDVELLAISRAGPLAVSVALCVDTSHIRIVDDAGNPVNSEDRLTRFPMQIDLEGPSLDELLVTDAFTYQGDKTCDD